MAFMGEISASVEARLAKTGLPTGGQPSEVFGINDIPSRVDIPRCIAIALIARSVVIAPAIGFAQRNPVGILVCILRRAGKALRNGLDGNNILDCAGVLAEDSDLSLSKQQLVTSFTEPSEPLLLLHICICGLSFPRKRESRFQRNGFRIKCVMTTYRFDC